MASNPRYKNGWLRRKHRQRFKAICAPCGICGGRLGAIHYDEPSNAKHPLSFVIDEIIPISKWKQAGYSSAAEAAQDFNNLQPAHYICNQLKGNKTNFILTSDKLQQREQGNAKQMITHKSIKLDGKW